MICEIITNSITMVSTRQRARAFPLDFFIFEVYLNIKPNALKAAAGETRDSDNNIN